MLDLIGCALTSEQIGYARIDGSKNELQRRKAIECFRSDTSCTVMLASIGSAGVG